MERDTTTRYRKFFEWFTLILALAAMFVGMITAGVLVAYAIKAVLDA